MGICRKCLHGANASLLRIAETTKLGKIFQKGTRGVRFLGMRWRFNSAGILCSFLQGFAGVDLFWWCLKLAMLWFHGSDSLTGWSEVLLCCNNMLLKCFFDTWKLKKADSPLSIFSSLVFSIMTNFSQTANVGNVEEINCPNLEKNHSH